MDGTREPRMTLHTQLVLQALMDDSTREMYGLEICTEAGLPSGTIHPILARLEKIGWLESRWEQIDTREEGRPRRRYYRLNPNNMAIVHAAVNRAKAKSQALRRLRPDLAGGA